MPFVGKFFGFVQFFWEEILLFNFMFAKENLGSMETWYLVMSNHWFAKVLGCFYPLDSLFSKAASRSIGKMRGFVVRFLYRGFLTTMRSIHITLYLHLFCFWGLSSFLPFGFLDVVPSVFCWSDPLFYEGYLILLCTFFFLQFNGLAFSN